MRRKVVYRTTRSILLQVLLLSSTGNSLLAASSREPTLCQEGECYHPDPLGGWGIKPTRIYKVVYNGSPVCAAVEAAMNRAIQNPDSSEANITHHVNIRVDLIAGTKPDGKPDSSSKYRSQNPIFSDPIFLQWAYLGGYPDFDLHHATPEYIPQDSYLENLSRWIIAPIGPDQTLQLIIWPNEVLNVDAAQLEKRDWSVPDEYRIAKATVKNDSLQLLNLNGKPFPMLDDNIVVANNWQKSVRLFDLVYLAFLSNSYYEILFDRYLDVVTVSSVGNAGKDICYISSSITHIESKQKDLVEVGLVATGKN